MVKKQKDEKEKETKEEKNASFQLQEAIEEIQKKFGEGSIMKLQDVKTVDIDSLRTGCTSIDVILGIGGLPRGRIIEIFGGESSGKTTLALHCISEAQKIGGVAAFIDAEHALDPEYAKRIGVDTKNLLISQPDSGEEALQIVETLVNSGKLDIIVVDSVAALTPKNEIAGEMGEMPVGLQARLMSHALRKLSGIIAKTKTIVIFLNQTRMKIGIMFGSPETTTGGMALKFYASVRINLKKIAQIKHGENIIGSRVKANIVKNKVAPPFRTAEFDIYFNEGISRAGDIMNVALKNDIIVKKGNTFFYGEEKLSAGSEGTRQILKENKELTNKIEKDIFKLSDAKV
jgi:recombination protein RecA